MHVRSGACDAERTQFRALDLSEKLFARVLRLMDGVQAMRGAQRRVKLGGRFAFA
jgi:hypothetical protein